jgi:hypothetical protein
MPHIFVTSCINANGDDINEMMQIPLCKNLSSANFISRIATKLGIDHDILDRLGYDSKRQFADDWALGCYKSYYQGIPCYLVQHSRIEYVFVDKKDLNKVLNVEEASARQTRLQVLSDDFDDLLLEQKPASQKEIYTLIKNFYLQNRDDLTHHRIPMSSFAQYQCNHRNEAALFDRKYYSLSDTQHYEPTF